MAEKAIFRCNGCGNIVELLHPGVGKLICCGQPMELLPEKTNDVGMEKHVPVAELFPDSVKLRIGSVPHPMEENHHIEWVEMISENLSSRRFLEPGEKPEAEFPGNNTIFYARAFCNVHGLWKTGIINR